MLKYTGGGALWILSKMVIFYHWCFDQLFRYRFDHKGRFRNISYFQYSLCAILTIPFVFFWNDHFFDQFTFYPCANHLAQEKILSPAMLAIWCQYSLSLPVPLILV